ncbi:hypothetical protein X945_5585 [Burkholderia pseudomallei ABCPW 107]|nr:hypothetical protein X945_5585 [Burkholderia pseudomallei ABCPW 107]
MRIFSSASSRRVVARRSTLREGSAALISSPALCLDKNTRVARIPLDESLRADR